MTTKKVQCICGHYNTTHADIIRRNETINHFMCLHCDCIDYIPKVKKELLK